MFAIIFMLICTLMKHKNFKNYSIIILNNYSMYNVCLSVNVINDWYSFLNIILQHRIEMYTQENKPLMRL